jgi:hypothetical protein
MTDIDHAARAKEFASRASGASGDHLTTPQAATIDAITGVVHALLAVHDELTQITGELRILNYERTHP